MNTPTLTDLVIAHEEEAARIRAEEEAALHHRMQEKREQTLTAFFRNIQPARHLLNFGDDDVSVSGLADHETAWVTVEFWQEIKGEMYLLRLEAADHIVNIVSANQRYRGGGYVKETLYAGEGYNLHDRLVGFAAKVAGIGVLKKGTRVDQ